jgi:hypothetical protein
MKWTASFGGAKAPQLFPRQQVEHFVIACPKAISWSERAVSPRHDYSVCPKTGLFNMEIVLRSRRVFDATQCLRLRADEGEEVDDLQAGVSFTGAKANQATQRCVI